MSNESAASPIRFFCFCGPTASGKSTICDSLVTRLDRVMHSISTTTRAPRGQEKDDVDYFFVDSDEFERRVKAGMFLEYAEYNGHRYGTELRNIDRARMLGYDLLLDIEVQGVQQLKKQFGDEVVVIFVIPPSRAELEARLRARGTESEAIIRDRLKIAARELALLMTPGFSDYVIVNDSLAESIDSAAAIVAGARCRAEVVLPKVRQNF